MSNTSTPPPVLDELFVHADFVRGLARALVRDAAEADDVVQETWLAALKRPPERGGRGWLGSVVRRRAARVHRDRGRRRGLEERAPGRGAGEAAAEAAGRDEQIRRLTTALLALPDAEREAVTLRFYEGLPPRHAADRLGIKVETFRSRVRRGLARMRKELDTKAGGDRQSWVLPLLPFAGAPSRASAPSILLVLGLGLALGLGAWAVFARRAGPEVVREEAAREVADAEAPSDLAEVTLGGSADEEAVPRAVPAPAPATEAPVATRPAATRPEEDILVFGRITDPSGAAVARAHVRLFARPEPPPISSMPDARLAPTARRVAGGSADATGHYRLTTSHAGDLDLVVDAPGRVLERVPVVAGARCDVVLDVGGALDVEVVDAKGGGVGGAEVSVVSARGNVPHRVVVTDEAGRATLEHLPLAALPIVAATPDRLGRTAAPVLPGRDAPTAVRIVLERRTEIFGRVVWASSGDAVVGARLRVDREPWTASDLDGVTDEEGRFSMRLPNDGVTTVHVHTDELGWIMSMVGRMAPGSVMGPMKPADPSEPLLVRLPDPPTYRAVEILVLDVAGEPLAGVDVRRGIEGVNGGLPRHGVTPHGKTDAAGRCRFRYRAGMAYIWFKATAPDGRTGVRMLPSRGDAEELVVHMPPAGSVKGRVVDAEGKPTAGAVVRLVMPGAVDFRPTTPQAHVHNAFRLAPNDFHLEAVTDVHGRFDLGRFPIGTYRLEATFDRDRFAYLDPLALDAGATKDVVLHLARSGFLRGRIDGAEAIVPGSLVIEARPDEWPLGRIPYQGSVFADGRFEVRGVPGPTCALEVRGYSIDGQALRVRREDVETGQEDLVLKLEAAR